MLQSVGTTELLIVAFIVLLLFGGKKIPEFFRGMGDAIREFNKASKDTTKDKKDKE
jgi:sec-independent protein translocase protein TatA